MSSIYVERQYLKSEPYTKIATDSGFTTGFCPLRNGWLIRDKWDDIIGWWYPNNHKLAIKDKTFYPVTFHEAIQLLRKE